MTLPDWPPGSTRPTEGGQTARIHLPARRATALVLSGGGARGAYEVGVLRYLREELPEALGRQPRFDYITGSSVGAVNAAFIAATLQRAPEQGAMLARVWTALHIDQVWRFRPWRGLRRMFTSKKTGGERHGGLLDTGPVDQVVTESTPWPWLKRNLRQRRFLGISISATDVFTGHPVNFVQLAPDLRVHPDAWDPHTTPIATELRPEHVLASASLPGLFPFVRVGQRFYADGSLRQNTPLEPALRMGAEKILVVSVRHGGPPAPFDPEQPVEFEERWRGPAFYAGKLFNAMYLDPLARQIHRIEERNQLIEAGRVAYDPRFAERINTELAARWGYPLRHIDLLQISPSADIGEIAAEMAHSIEPRGGWINRRLIERLTRTDDPKVSDLTSYLLFDGAYAERLIELGFRDAQARREELLEFFAFQAV